MGGVQSSSPTIVEVERLKHNISRKGRSKFEASQNKYGYLFIAPWLIGFVFFWLLPAAFSFFTSFMKWNMIEDMKFIGVKNYGYLLKDMVFQTALRNTLKFTIFAVAISFALALGLALLLNINSKLMYFFRTTFYIPSVISGVAVAIVWAWIFSKETGVLNYILGLFGVEAINWLGSPDYSMAAFIMMMSTSLIGTPLITFLAALQNVPLELYEAAEIDGASGRQKIWYVTLPTIRGISIFNLVTLIIGSFRVFVQASTLAGKDGDPNRSLLFMVMNIYNTAFERLQMGYAAAMSWVFFLMVFAVCLIVLKVTSKE